MNEENFKKGIKEIQNIRMTEAEKRHILEKVFAIPTESPFLRRAPAFLLTYIRQSQVLVAASLVVVLSFGGVLYASDESLPGDILYPVKTQVIEPVLDVVNRTPEKKIVWEEEKVTRRIVEAEKLIEKDELNEDRLIELERKIERSSVAFTVAADVVASSSGTTTVSRKEKADSLKREFRARINERREIFNKKINEYERENKRESEEREEEKERNKSEDKNDSENNPDVGVKVEIKDVDKVSNELHEDNSATKIEINSSYKQESYDIQKKQIQRLTDTAIRALGDDDEDEEDVRKDIDTELEGQFRHP